MFLKNRRPDFSARTGNILPQRLQLVVIDDPAHLGTKKSIVIEVS